MKCQNRFLALLLLFAATAAAAQTDTTFTYQGTLTDQGAPANGLYDIAVDVHDAPSGGNVLGARIEYPDVPVTDGLFTLQIDLGTSHYGVREIWLEIRVDTVRLLPRQHLTPAPFALHARGVFVDNVGNVEIGTSAAAATLTANGPVLSVGTNGGTLYTANPNNQSASFSLGWMDDVARLRIGGSGPGASGGLDIQRVGDASLMRILHNGNVGIGTSLPAAKLHVVDTSASQWGILVHKDGNGVSSRSVAGIGIQGITDAALHPAVYGIATATGLGYAVRGDASHSSGYDFYAGGAGINYGATLINPLETEYKSRQRPARQARSDPGRLLRLGR